MESYKMKRVYALLFNLSIISTHSVAKPTKIDSKYETEKQKQTIVKKNSSLKTKIVNYKIEEGDTLFIIARKHHTTVAEVKNINHLADNAVLKIGCSLQVPLNTYFPKEMNIQSALKMIQERTAQKEQIVKKEKLAKKTPTYTIQSGDTLLGIALSHETTLTKLANLNGFDINKTLKLGEVIKLPHDTPTSSHKASKTNKTKLAKVEKTSTKSAKEYTIKDGDTLLGIALSHETTLTKLANLNGFDINKTLKLGEVIKLPQDTPKSSHKASKTDKTKLAKVEKKSLTTKEYKIKSGDTLLAIALKHNTTLSTLEKLNGFDSKKTLKLGEVISVPKDVEKTPTKMKKRIAFTKKHKKTLLTYTIKKGDTLNKIARKHDITVVKLIKINKLNPRKSLKIGAKLSLVTKSKSKSKIAKIHSKKNHKFKKRRIASVKSHKKRVKRKHRTKKFAVAHRTTKKSFIERLGWGSSSLKLTAAKKQLGKKYVWGATGPYSFDCSGFTKYVCDKNGICIPRTSIKQSKVGKRVTRSQLKAGDLIFFDTSRRRRGYVNHVGIYIGHNKFIHASSAKRKVVITSLEAPFYKARFKWGSRVKD